MRLWQLSPVDESVPNWEASSFRGTVIVRARDAAEARATAQRAFGIKTRFPPQHGVIAPPWLRLESVHVEPIEDSRYASTGPAEVLVPAPP